MRLDYAVLVSVVPAVCVGELVHQRWYSEPVGHPGLQDDGPRDQVVAPRNPAGMRFTQSTMMPCSAASSSRASIVGRLMSRHVSPAIRHDC
ncbi:hypothetical protein BW737_008765 [Actinomyces ruminis]|uniref:Secreted protein n=1 Tax=Actinomyces ruminis TaxID=1937003 RepID=A0ABX4MAU8_9ACTO|nr:hypothetical protein BW737_008765 [Actinomyces ruminis]